MAITNQVIDRTEELLFGQSINQEKGAKMGPMTEVSSSTEQVFKNDPYIVIRSHLEEVGRPEEAFLNAAASVIQEEYHEFGGRKDAFGVCIELPQRVTYATAALAALFDSQSKEIPAHWRANPEIMRTVVSMCGNLELGLLKAQQIHLARSGGGNSIPDRIKKLTKLVDDLQQK